MTKRILIAVGVLVLNSILLMLFMKYQESTLWMRNISESVTFVSRMKNSLILDIPIILCMPIFLLLFSFIIGVVLRSIYLNSKPKNKAEIFIREKFINSCYYGGIEGFLFALILFFTIAWSDFATKYCDKYLYFLNKFPREVYSTIFLILPMMPIYYLYGKICRMIDDSKGGIKKPKLPIKQSPKTKDLDDKKESNSGWGKPLPSVDGILKEYKILAIYESISRFCIFILPLLYLYSNYNLLYPFDELTLNFISIFLVFNLAFTAFLFICINDLHIKQLFTIISGRYMLIVVAINIYGYFIKKELFSVVYLKYFFLIYILICIWAILSGYKNFFLIDKNKKLNPGHYYFLLGAMSGLSISLLRFSIGAFKISKSNIYLFSKSAIYIVVALSSLVVTYFIVKKKDNLLSKHESVNLLVLFSIFLLAWFCFADFKSMQKIDYLVILCILPIFIIALINLKIFNIKQIFIIRTLYIVITIFLLSVALNIVTLTKIKDVFIQNKNILVQQGLTVIVTLFLGLITRGRILNNRKR